jgi:tetratricopeptide (TPR) repeat protein
MDIRVKIKGLVKESELYHDQGLLTEAKQKLVDAAKLIGSIENLKNKDKVLAGIKKKIQGIDTDIARVESAPVNPQVAAESQELIKKLFSFSASKNEGAAALEEAITLTKFGQYDKALKEFQLLLRDESVRLAAAKNIIRCHMANHAFEDGVAQFREWMDADLFSEDQLGKTRAFFQSLLDKKGVGINLPDQAKDKSPAIEISADDADDGEEEILDINSIGLTFESGPKQGKMVELDVSFQNGNVISVLITGRDRGLVEHLRVGDKLGQVQFYSPIAIFQGSGLISAKTEIKVGPRKGDFSVDIKVSST